MYKIGITREGNDDGIEIDGKKKIFLGNLRPEFVKRNQKKYKIVFVGMYTFKKDEDTITIYSLPKYYPREKCKIEYLEEIKKTIKKLCAVVEKLRNTDEVFDDVEYLFEPYNIKSKKKNVNRMELAEYIIEDYLHNGLYVKDLTVARKNGKGRTSWSRTVAKLNPIIQGENVIYLDYINKEHLIDNEDIISIIHANVVNQCLEFIGSLWSGEIIPIDNKEILGADLSGYTNVINTYSTYVFREREINLLKALEAWCGQTKYYDNYAGITCFDRVWERVNDAVWGNIHNVKTGEPIYRLGAEAYKGKGNAIPDTIRVEPLEQNDKKNVYVFDSKYYTIKGIKDGKIEGWPTNADIAKQIEYVELLKQQINEQKKQSKETDGIRIEYKNAFLLPECSECFGIGEKENFTLDDTCWFKKIGYVEQGKFGNLLKEILKIECIETEGGKVDLIIVRPDRLFDVYLNDECVKADELLSIWK